MNKHNITLYEREKERSERHIQEEMQHTHAFERNTEPKEKESQEIDRD